MKFQEKLYFNYTYPRWNANRNSFHSFIFLSCPTPLTGKLNKFNQKNLVCRVKFLMLWSYLTNSPVARQDPNMWLAHKSDVLSELSCYSILYNKARIWHYCLILGVPCGVVIPQKAPVHCHETRSKDLAKHRGIYKLGHVNNLPFPMSDINAFMLINLTLADPFTATWMKLYGYMLKKNLALIQSFPKTNTKEFTKISDYEGVYHFFIKQQQNEEMVIYSVVSCCTI